MHESNSRLPLLKKAAVGYSSSSDILIRIRSQRIHASVPMLYWPMEKKTGNIKILRLTLKAVVLVCARIPPGFQNHRFRGHVASIWTIYKGYLFERSFGWRALRA
jgi:hypothetical protein